ncbi:alpha/beta hydrolase [Candidatus Minimicrobia naudis]|uniref:Alpha/beta hydrolase n=1 Tax=Candidatus Minimicrobia naudis TaxID=2841263 RepID=A0A8F1MCL5_9BACT|nr:alpha/beta hydrolase [Candidatus Minimicrobia naudis]
MNMLPMYDKFLGEISSDFMDVGGVKTAYYFYQGGSNKTILLIHGIGGDFHGMIPLAYHLKNDANLVFVDLPSHGRSQLIKNMKMSDIENWAINLMPGFWR